MQYNKRRRMGSITAGIMLLMAVGIMNANAESIYDSCMSELSPSATYAEKVVKDHECQLRERNADLQKHISQGQSVPQGLETEVYAKVYSFLDTCESIYDDYKTHGPTKTDATSKQCYKQFNTDLWKCYKVQFNTLPENFDVAVKAGLEKDIYPEVIAKMSPEQLQCYKIRYGIKDTNSQTNIKQWQYMYELYLAITNIKESSNTIPEWLKNHADWWAAGTMSDDMLLQDIKYMNDNNILFLSHTNGKLLIPSWVKKNAYWWAHGQITDGDYIQGLQYMFNSGIIQIK